MSDNRTIFGRYAVGIDLGTTNCSVCYVDLESTEATPQMLPLLQTVAAGETAEELLLPSFCYLPGAHELPDGALSLPWDKSPRLTVGVFARNQGAFIPERVIASAKSWLAHSGVNRRGKILPWGSDLGQQMLSPLQASFQYLEHIRNVWDTRFAKLADKDGTPCRLAEQTVTVTVPASFDETARKLTLEAAEMAGLRHVTLLEEPLAAFYSFLAHNSNWQEMVQPGACVLVVDVGGGTSDFSIIQMEEGNTLRRTAVGDHLLLGGDNMDMTLARMVESDSGRRLTQRQWTQLCHECRLVKEKLLSDGGPETAEARLTGQGSSLFANTIGRKFTSAEVEKIILDGFFPLLPQDAPSPERRQGMREMGLPYASDPAVTRHILQFLRTEHEFIKPTHILFNGGAMLPQILRNRVLDAVQEWCGGNRPVELPSYDLSLAVSDGAANYTLARTGRSVRVKGGIARAYYIAAESNGQKTLVCVMPRDTDENIIQTLDGNPFILRTNQPVSFQLHASATRLGDKLGDVIELDENITPLPPLFTTIRLGKSGNTSEVAAGISSMLSETGVLELWCDVPEAAKRFPLEFDLRGDSQDSQQSSLTIDQAQLDKALEYITTSFESPTAPGVLMKKLEEILECGRAEWNLLILRRISDLLIGHSDWRRASAQHESRWLNLCGYCLRPGCGYAGDEWRVSEAWKLWFNGPLFPKNVECAAQWHIFWRRLAAGLKSGQQSQAFDKITKSLLTATGTNAIRDNDQAGIEMWRFAASLEQVSPQKKLKLLQAIVSKSGKISEPLFWIVGRLAARVPMQNATDCVIPSAKLLPLFPEFLQRINQAGNPKSALFALASASRLSGVRTIDLPEKEREQAAKFLAKHNAPEHWTKMPLEIMEDDAETRKTVFGEELPLGLVMA